MEKLFFLKAANHFCETLLLGNGRMGAAVYGGVDEDVYTLNDDTLWTGYPRDNAFDGVGLFKEAKEQILSGNAEAAQATLWELYGDHGQSYQPAGTLRVKADYGEYSDYKRTLTLKDALHTTAFCTEGGKYRRQAFASHPDDVICIRYEGDVALPPMEISLSSKLRSAVYFENDTMILSGEAAGDGVPACIEAKERLIYSEDPAKKGMRYAVALRTRTDGRCCFEDGVLHIAGGSYLEIYLTIRTSFAGFDRHPYLDGIDEKAAVLEILDRISDVPYATLLKRHTEDFGALFERVEFELEGGRPDLPTDERLKAHAVTPDAGLYALLYQFGRYLMISSSRPGTQPTNLQALWNEETVPAWCSNYTVNINTQMNYWGACGANLAECCEPLCRMIYELSESGKKTAKHLFGAEGFCVNHNVDIWRMTHPAGNWSKGGTRYSYFPLAGAWLTRHLYDYYLETKDLDFLRGKAFDAIMGSARFCDSMLTEHGGELIFCPATSPENEYLQNGQKYALTKSSAMFQSIVRDALEICIACCHLTGRETAYAHYLEERLARIPWLSVGSDGRILEWDEERVEKDIHHRHLSHLYSFYPAKKVKDKRFLEACRRSLDARGDDSTGWGSVWKMCLWATLRDGNRALALADRLLSLVELDLRTGYKGGIYPNLLCACPPFQVDGNFGFVAAINEMLVQENDGQLELLPALPDFLKNGKVKGLRLHGRTIDIEWRDGNILHSSVTN